MVHQDYQLWYQHVMGYYCTIGTNGPFPARARDTEVAAVAGATCMDIGIWRRGRDPQDDWRLIIYSTNPQARIADGLIAPEPQMMVWLFQWGPHWGWIRPPEGASNVHWPIGERYLSTIVWRRAGHEVSHFCLRQTRVPIVSQI